MPLRKWFLTFFFGIAVTLYADGQSTDFILHRFQLSDGAGPQGSLIADAQENLYGVTYAGGSGTCTYNELPSGCGIIFELSRMPGIGWSEQTLYEFQGGNDGAFPMAGLIFDGLGNLYGTTSAGGVGCGAGVDGGCGTVFELSPPMQAGGPWNETVLYRLTGESDGYGPTGSLLFDSAGDLYGTTQRGSSGGVGTVFELTPPQPGGSWNEITLHSFDPSQPGGDGARPSAGLVFDTAGNLYGTTLYGGTTNGNCISCGTVFRLRPPESPGAAWTEEIVHSFQGAPDGQGPEGDLIIVRGDLVGTTVNGGETNAGAVFEVTQSSQGVTEAVLYSFQGGSDGEDPVAGLLVDGAVNLYGTTISGGNCTDPHGCGTVFQLMPPQSPKGTWTKNTLYTFQGGSDGAYAPGGLLLGQGWLVGLTTQGGGSQNCSTNGVIGCGTVFAVRQ